MFKKFIILSSFLICCITFISCEKKVSSDTTAQITIVPTQTPTSNDTSSTSNIEVIYQGFIMVDENKVNDYAMLDNYIITTEDDWKTWSSKYTSDYPYYLDDLGMNWDNECLVVRAYYGAKDFYNTIDNIKDVSFDNNIVEIIYNENETPIYAFNSTEYNKKNIAIYVIKVNKPNNLVSIDSKYLTYETYSQENK